MQHGIWRPTSCRLSSAVSRLHAPQRCLVLAHLPRRLCLAGAGERLSGYSQWTEHHHQKLYTTVRKRPSRRRASDHQKKLDRTFLLGNFPPPRIEQLTASKLGPPPGPHVVGSGCRAADELRLESHQPAIHTPVSDSYPGGLAGFWGPVRSVGSWEDRGGPGKAQGRPWEATKMTDGWSSVCPRQPRTAKGGQKAAGRRTGN
ncbi:hypothetical protein EDB80DRAFT_404918 [Ilyonectria destructans]|nr:hypothetical protein EDB80DRAFT_404918 [Ilyonectria destructans]